MSTMDSVQQAPPPPQENGTAATATWTPTKEIKQIMIAQVLVLFAISLDMTILTATLPNVAKELNADAVATFWIAASFLLANAVVQPLMASFADIFGRRWAILTAMLLFTLGSGICCGASNVAMMLAGRVIQGVGGGGILAVNLIIISDLIPLRMRAHYIAIQQFVIALGLNTAPIIGGAFVEATTWRWLFYINFPFCAIGLVAIWFAIKYDEPKSSMSEKLGTIDWFGSLAFIAGMTASLLGITWGGTQFPWVSAATLVPLIVGLVVVVATGFYEELLAKNPFLRPTVFNTCSAFAIYFCTVLQGLTLFAQVYFLTLWLITVKDYTPLVAGACLLAFSMVCILSSGIVGLIIPRVGCYRWAIWIGWIITTVGTGLLIMLDVETPTRVWMILFIVAGIGQGMIFIAHSIAAQAECDQKDAAHAMCIYSFMRSLGLCLGVSLGGTIWANFLQSRISDLDLPDNLTLTGEAAIFVVSNLPEAPFKDEVVAALAGSFQELFKTLNCIAGVGLIIGFAFIKGRTLNQDPES